MSAFWPGSNTARSNANAFNWREGESSISFLTPQQASHQRQFLARMESGLVTPRNRAGNISIDPDPASARAKRARLIGKSQGRA